MANIDCTSNKYKNTNIGNDFSQCVQIWLVTVHLVYMQNCADIMAIA